MALGHIGTITAKYIQPKLFVAMIYSYLGYLHGYLLIGKYDRITSSLQRLCTIYCTRLHQAKLYVLNNIVRLNITPPDISSSFSLVCIHRFARTSLRMDLPETRVACLQTHTQIPNYRSSPDIFQFCWTCPERPASFMHPAFQ